MATEQLIIDLNARTNKLDAKLKATQDKIDGLTGKTKKADMALFKFGRVAGGVGKGLGKMGAIAEKAALGMAAVSAAVGVISKASSDYAKQLEINSRLMKVSIEEAQALAAAVNTVGIDLEKLGDISKDTSEKLGDFINTGGGGFQDFADAVGLSKEEAQKAARSFQGMAGTDVLGAMVKRMEEAGASSEQMSHALEGMGSDATRLIPLLQNSGAEMRRLKDDFYETSVVLNETDVKKLKDMSANFSELGATFRGTMGKFSVEYADQINSIIDTTQKGMKIAGDEIASGALTDRLNAFYSAFSGSWAAVMGENREELSEFSRDAGEIITSLGKLWLEFVLTLPINLAVAGNKIKELFSDVIDELMIKLGELNVQMQKGLEFLGVGGDVAGAEKFLETINAEVDARDAAHEKKIQQYEEEKARLLESFALEQELANIKREQYSQDEEVRLKANETEYKADNKRVKGVLANNKIEYKSEAELQKGKEKAKEDFTKSAAVLNEHLFNNNKAIGAGIIVAETAQNVVTSVKNSGGVPWGLPAGAAAAAMGIAQLSALKSSSKGGGSISAGGVSAPSAPAQQQSFIPETSNLDVTQISSTSQQELIVTLKTEDGESLAKMLGGQMKELERRGG